MAQAQSLAPTRSRFGGWPLFGVNAALLTIMAIALAAQHNFGVEGVRLVVRTTAQTSLFFFLIAFTASSLHTLFPSGPTRWLLRNRRYFGVSFAYSHFIHAVALYTFAQMAPETFAPLASTAMFVFGGTAYAFIALMTLTSFDRTAALIGPRAWRILHTTGAHFIWLVFMVSEGRRVPYDSYYIPFVAALVAAMALRFIARARRKRVTATG